MLTPSSSTVADYIAAIKSDNPSHVRITFLGQNVVLTDGDIEYSGITLHSYLNGDTDLTMGKSVMNSINIPIIHTAKEDGLIWSGEFQLEIGQEVNGITDWVTVGYFAGNRPAKVNNVNIIDFVAYDRMNRFEILADEWINSLVYPMTLEDIYQSICDWVDVGYETGDELQNIFGRSYTESPFHFEGKTLREILAQIAEACGCYAKITADGNCKLVWFTDHTAEVEIDEDDEFSTDTFDNVDGKTWEDLEAYKWEDLEHFSWSDLGGTKSLFEINSLNVIDSFFSTNITIPSARNGTIYTIVDNPFLAFASQQDIDDYISPIFNRLSAFGGYLPMSVECLGNALVEAGDIITVNANGETFEMPIFCKTMRWNGAMVDSYETTGQLNRAEVSAETLAKISDGAVYRLTMEQIRLIAQGKYDIQSDIDILPEGITVTGGKYVRIVSGGTFDVNSANFQIDSVNKLLRTGKWKLTEDGIRVDFDDDSYGIIDIEDVSTAYWNSGKAFRMELFFPADGSGTPSHCGLIFSPSGLLATDPNDPSKYIGGLDIKPLLVQAGNDYGFGEIGKFQSGSFHDVYYNALHQVSTRNLKRDIKAMRSEGERLDKLQPVTFVYKDDKTGQVRHGLIYEDTIDVMPEICSDNGEKKTINYVELIPVLLKEIQDLRKRVAELERGR